MSTPPVERPLRLRDVTTAWWPLAVSWLLMAVEQPAIAAVISRLPDFQLQLAAYGVVFPLALVIEAPIIMLLAASTELCRDRASYRALRRFTHRAGAILTGLHILVAFTPLWDVLVEGVMGVPTPVVERARLGFILLTPWTWSIASRRTGQGVLIRYGYSRSVGVGTGVRLVAAVTVLTVGLVVGTWPGTAVGAVALSVGVLSEAAFISIRLRQVVAKHLQHDDLEHAPLRGRAFLAFYLPLMAMPLVTLVIQPLGTAAIARMPAVIDSLAVWPVVMGLLFVLQSVGLAFNEVVVALLDRPGARRGLWRFTLLITIATSAILVLIVATPLSGFVFSKVVGLTPELTVMATAAVALALPIPGTRALQSWYQGVLVNLRRTTAITEAVVAFALVCLLVMGIGVARHELPGLYMAILAYSAGRIVQTFWLAWRCHHAMRQGAT